MAHIDYSFQMSGDPQAAQALFVRDIVPELARDASFHVVGEHPGSLAFNDALSSDEDDPDLDASQLAAKSGDEEDLGDAPGTPWLGADWSPGARFSAQAPIGGGQNLLARHLQVEFTAAAGGTVVRVHGHARRHLRVALERLGTPGHWPETAGPPHDSIA